MSEGVGGGGAFLPVLGAVVVSFAAISLLSAVLFDVNSTQAVLIGGFGAVVAAVSAAVTTRRTAGD